ncbi:MAG: hypothetical protein ACR2PS_16900, partial [Pseudomonadales bacterium]
MSTRVQTIPEHIPPELVFEFDMANCTRQDGDLHRFWKDEAQDSKPDIFWTPFHQGHWVVTRAKDITAIQSDPEHFSNREVVIPKGIVPRLIPWQLDPPSHMQYRALIMPFLMPRALKAIEDKARAVAIELIEELKPRGGCDFAMEFSGVMPLVAFLTMMELPIDDLEMLRGHAAIASKPHHPDCEKGWQAIADYINKWIDIRRENPSNDPI